MYKILGVDQKEYGPVSAEVVRQWIAQGRANAQTRVKTEAGLEWHPLGGLPEFADLFGSPAPQPNLPPPPVSNAFPSVVGAPKTGMAITSMVLGIVSLVCGSIFTGIPAIITGHIAHGRARRAPSEFGGGGFAIAGFVMGYCSMVFTVVMLAAMLPAIGKARGQGPIYQLREQHEANRPGGPHLLQ